MPKRKRPRTREEDIDHYRNKIKKLERKIRDRQYNDGKSASESDEFVYHDENETDTPALIPSDWLIPPTPVCEINNNKDSTAFEPQPGPSSAPDVVPDENTVDLDTEVLQILGDDPSGTEKYASEIHKELAGRLLHVVKEGLSKELRKDLISKYPLPMNCVQIDAPKINPEIKAAIAETCIKRDKGIEIKQKQMTSAIACLSGIINAQLTSNIKNNELLQQLMDISRILCDIQHADSITRRNFILFALKNEMKEHLKNTKIDSFLFGDNLAEILRSAKAVNKSGVELKADTNKVPNTRFKGAATKPLNRRAPPQARRQPAGRAPPLAARSNEPAAARASFHRPPPPPPQQLPLAHSSRTSQPLHATYPRRRY